MTAYILDIKQPVPCSLKSKKLPLLANDYFKVALTHGVKLLWFALKSFGMINTLL